MTIKAGAGCSMHTNISNNLLLNFATGFDFYKKKTWLLLTPKKYPSWLGVQRPYGDYGITIQSLVTLEY